MLKSDQNMFFLISVSPFLWNRFQNLAYLGRQKADYKTGISLCPTTEFSIERTCGEVHSHFFIKIAHFIWNDFLIIVG